MAFFCCCTCCCHFLRRGSEGHSGSNVSVQNFTNLFQTHQINHMTKASKPAVYSVFHHRFRHITHHDQMTLKHDFNSQSIFNETRNAHKPSLSLSLPPNTLATSPLSFFPFQINRSTVQCRRFNANIVVVELLLPSALRLCGWCCCCQASEGCTQLCNFQCRVLCS